MDEPQPLTPPVALPGQTWTDLRWIVLLVVLLGGLRVWQILNTEVATRDSVVYIRYAWRLEHEPWGKVIRQEIQHPGYGVLVYLVGKPVRALVPVDLPLAMQYAAQIASALASLLLIVPMFYLGKELFDARVAFWSCLLFQVMPSPGQLMPDGLSEPLFLLLTTSALCFTAWALREGRIVWYFLAGLCTGLAYLTRTEGLIIVPAALGILALRQCYRAWRLGWLTFGRNGAALAAGCAVVAVPFMLHIGGISLKSSFRHITDSEGWQQPAAPAKAGAALNVAQPWAAWNIGPNVQPRDRVVWAAWALVQTLYEVTFHVVGPLILVGLWLYRRRFVEVPGAAVMLLAGGTLALLLWRLGQSAGYLGDRHVMLIVLGGVYFGVAGVAALGHRLAGGRHAWVSVVLLLALVGFCLPRTMARLHGNRMGFREAGVWLAANSLPGDDVFDPMAWTAYHAGRIFTPADAPRSDPPVCYVVLERSKNKHPHMWYLMDLAEDLIRHGEVVYRQPTRRDVEIVIYRVPRPARNTPSGHHLMVWLAATYQR